MYKIMEMLPFIIPLIIIQFVLMITALVHVLKHSHYRFGNKIMWVLIVVAINIIGPIVYFIFGREDE